MMTQTKLTSIFFALAVFTVGCDAEEFEELDDAEFLDEDVDQDPAVPIAETIDSPETEDPNNLANSSDHLNTCKWRRTELFNSVNITATCNSGEKVVSGGCYHNNGGINVIRSHPIEQNSNTNLPEDGEFWYATDGATGWRCKYSGSHQFHTGIATALCCGVDTSGGGGPG